MDVFNPADLNDWEYEWVHEYDEPPHCEKCGTQYLDVKAYHEGREYMEDAYECEGCNYIRFVR